MYSPPADPYPDHYAAVVHEFIDMWHDEARTHHKCWLVTIACAGASTGSAAVFAFLGEMWMISAAVALFLVWQARRIRRDRDTARAQARALERLAHPITLQHLWDTRATPLERLAFVLDPVRAEQDLIGHPL